MQELTLTAEQVSRFQDWLTRHGAIRHRDCFVCSEVAWVISDRIYLFPAVVTPDRTAEFIRTAPFVALICDNCGYTTFFSAARLNLGLAVGKHDERLMDDG